MAEIDRLAESEGRSRSSIIQRVLQSVIDPGNKTGSYAPAERKNMRTVDVVTSSTAYDDAEPPMSKEEFRKVAEKAFAGERASIPGVIKTVADVPVIPKKSEPIPSYYVPEKYRKGKSNADAATD